MRPRLINRTALPGAPRTRITSTGAWLTTTPDQGLAHLYDDTLRPITGETTPPGCHLDDNGTLWTHLGERRQLLALDAVTGRERARTAVPGGDGWFTPHERGEWPVLNLAARPPEDIHIVPPELTGDHITIRTLATDGHLIGFAGDQAVILGYGTIATQRLDGSQRHPIDFGHFRIRP
ncbi:hypothetical protein Ait01nite_012590 [Actinoplanes italicus]|uniref:Uncharacterized protein n=1 Tax=Actinoplanes italicus TaxID=113567 RepID=A0A2T0KGX9_9ACTN|nr:hypothetical protein [Actinoplanes italicus]PRX22693.1 hypothetical protein CLV67_104221 [Actinoplanes italicus]GIE28214.1 hypothetical protein Ait01nite_012590 [Actinoplanes italicus]